MSEWTIAVECDENGMWHADVYPGDERQSGIGVCGGNHRDLSVLLRSCADGIARREASTKGSA